MPDVYTSTANSSLDTTAYDQALYFALRPNQYFDQVADVKPSKQSHQGATVQFTFMADMGVATTTLNESTDVDAVAVTDSVTTVTMYEYGNATLTTAKLRGTSFAIDPNILDAVKNVVGFNAAQSQDALALAPLVGGSNVRYAGSAAGRTTITPASKLRATDVRYTVAKLRGASSPTFNGFYASFIHPDVAVDLREETGAAAWRDPHTYSQPGEIWNGEIGAFEGARFVETPTAHKWADAGSSTTLTDVYATLFLGRQALAKTYSSTVSGPNPQVVLGNIVDKLKRQQPVGWYWLAGYGRFREASLYRVESASSIGSN